MRPTLQTAWLGQAAPCNRLSATTTSWAYVAVKQAETRKDRREHEVSAAFSPAHFGNPPRSAGTCGSVIPDSESGWKV